MSSPFHLHCQLSGEVLQLLFLPRVVLPHPPLQHLPDGQVSPHLLRNPRQVLGLQQSARPRLTRDHWVRVRHQGQVDLTWMRRSTFGTFFFFLFFFKFNLTWMSEEVLFGLFFLGLFFLIRGFEVVQASATLTARLTSTTCYNYLDHTQTKRHRARRSFKTRSSFIINTHRSS